MHKVNLPDRYAQMEAEVRFKKDARVGTHGGFWLDLAQFMKENDLVYMEVSYGNQGLASEPVREGMGVQPGAAELSPEPGSQKKGGKGHSLFTKKG